MSLKSPSVRSSLVRMNEPVSTDLLLTTEASRILQVSAETVRVWERRGYLSAIRTAGGVRLFARADVQRLAQERQSQLKAADE